MSSLQLELLYELEAKIVRAVEIGKTNIVGRTDFHMIGVVRGKINGKYEGIDYGLIVQTDEGDAVYVHVHETITTDNGVIAGVRRGYAIPVDNQYKVRTFTLHQTSIREFRYLNWTLCIGEGFAGPDGLKLKIYAVR